MSSCKNSSEELRIDLNGQWRFKIDSTDIGVSDKWYTKKLTEIVQLPGSMVENDKGNEISVATNWTGNMWNDSLWYTDPKMKKYRQKGNVKVPFWLTPKKEYKGAAWYQKDILIPENWSDKHATLFLERVHWESQVWIDNQFIGLQNTLATPHNYLLKKVLTPGKHRLTIRVDNRVKDINVGLDAHSISDNTQSNWNGIVGNIALKAVPKLSIRKVKITPIVKDKKIKVHFYFNNNIKSPHKYRVSLKVYENFGDKKVFKTLEKEVELVKHEELVFDYLLGEDMKLWDEFHPNLYTLEVSISSEFGTEKHTEVFGMRDFKVNDKIFTINNKPVFLRGTLECAIFPKTGYPPTDVASWKHIYKTIKAHGLNHMRFHSWCPPKAAFTAADEMGVYLQVEASSWTSIGDKKPIDNWIYKEAQSIIDNYGNHPSFVLMAYGNEPGGKNHKQYLKEFVTHFKNKENRILFTGGAGWPYLENADFFNHRGPRIQGWNENLKSVINAKAPQTVFDWSKFVNKVDMPYVSHEMGQWCVYPNFEEMEKYTGVLKPKNFEIFKETLEENNLGNYAKSFLYNSGKLQALCYKADIEAALRTKNLAGFQLLDLHDFPGQGTALVGVLDAFWDEKGYISPKEFKAFSGQTVPLARLEKRTFKNTDTLNVAFEIAHFGENELENITPKWSLTDVDNQIFKQGNLAKTNVQIGNGIQLGKLKLPLLEIKEPKQLQLSLTVNQFQNSWDIWVYPAAKPINSQEIRVVSTLDAKTIQFLENGGKVLLNTTKGDIKAGKGGNIGIGFSSIFWNTSWTKEQKPHTLGILCKPEHPAFKDFPTESHSNWQWWDAMSHSNAVIIDNLQNVEPIVRVIDDWSKNRSLALVFEAKIGKGKLLFSSIDLHTNLTQRIEAQQMLQSFKKYMLTDDFNPENKLNIKQIRQLLNN